MFQHRNILISEMNLNPGDMILLQEYGFSEWSFYIYIAKSPGTVGCHLLMGGILPCNDILDYQDDWFDSWRSNIYHRKHNVQDHVETLKL